MKRILFLAGFLASLAASAQQAVGSGTGTYFQIDLAPSGKLLSKDQPVLKGNAYVFRSYPAGTLMSLRRSEIKHITKITPEAAAAANYTESLVPIGNLAMQGGSSQAGRTNASAVRPRAGASGPELGEGFYSDLKMGETLAPDAGSSGDYSVGRNYGFPPSSAVQSSPGAPPTMPAATSGVNPPTMSSTASGANPQ